MALHFTLHLDKPLASKVEMATWNPEKDLLAMVSADQQLTVHRFNWQRLWAVTPEKRVTCICWRPDGKSLAAGYEDGKISLHNVENGDITRTIETHKASVRCLHWVEENLTDKQEWQRTFEHRTSRFFPPAPKIPVMPGTGPAFDVVGAVSSWDTEDGSQKPVQHLSVLCSGDNEGFVCLNAFGVFPVGKLDVRKLTREQLCLSRIVLSLDLCNMSLICHDSKAEKHVAISIDTSLLRERHKQIHQVALEASSVEELLEVLKASFAVMRSIWSDAIDMFFEKFNVFRTLLREHGSHSSPRDELLSLLACGSATASLHQFLAATLGEPGLKRLAKTIDGACKELQNIIAEHLQPASEILAFRMGELLGMSRWRVQFQPIGLDNALVNAAMEDAGMLMVQVERFIQIVGDVTGQFRLFFLWLTKSLKQLNNESQTPQSDQNCVIDSAVIAGFLKSQFENDPIGPHLNADGGQVYMNSEEDQARVEELVFLGGYKDTKFLERTLFQQFGQLCNSCRSAFSMPVAAISPRLALKRRIPLSAFDSPLSIMSLKYLEVAEDGSSIDYTCCTDGSTYIGVLRGFATADIPEVAVLLLPDKFTCVDLALYKENQLLLLLTETFDGGQAWIMVVRLADFAFVPLNDAAGRNLIETCIASDAGAILSLKTGKARSVPYLDVVPPLAVSASRGLASVFVAQRRALLYDLEENEEEDNEDEM